MAKWSDPLYVGKVHYSLFTLSNEHRALRAVLSISIPSLKAFVIRFKVQYTFSEKIRFHSIYNSVRI